MTDIAIHNEAEAIALLQRALAGEFENDVISLDFENWPSVSFRVQGDRYHSSLPTSMMRALIDLQVHLNRVYAEILYGRSARALTEEDRQSIEIIYKVEEGSSQVLADLSAFFEQLAKSAIDKMTGKQLVITVLGVAALVAAGSGLDAYMTHAEATQQEANRAHLEQQLVAQNQRLAEIQRETALALAGVVKSVPDAESVTVNGAHTFTQDDIRELATTERSRSVQNRIDGPYQVVSIKTREDRWRIELIGEGDTNRYQMTADLLKGQPYSQPTIEAITRSLARATPVNLSVIGRLRGDTVTVASILGLNNQLADR